ncbi:MAG: ribosome silencing factor [Armatimonadetes bacterium]|nr:ribosome silencing factor [Armatimonadota bacterium]
MKEYLSKEIVILGAEILREKKAQDIVILNLTKLAPICDYFLIAGGNSKTHTKALADYLENSFKKEKILKKSIQGYLEGSWILLDYGEVIIHIFTEEKRKFYNLEEFWHKAERINF